MGDKALLEEVCPWASVGVSEAQTRPLHNIKTLLTNTEVGTREWGIAMIDLFMFWGLGIRRAAGCFKNALSKLNGPY